MKGAELVNKPVSLSWNELATRDIKAATAFYTKVFPWTAKTNDMGGGQEYTEWQIDGKSIGGAMTIGGMIPASVHHTGWCTSSSPIPTIRSRSRKSWAPS